MNDYIDLEVTPEIAGDFQTINFGPSLNEAGKSYFRNAMLAWKTDILSGVKLKKERYSPEAYINELEQEAMACLNDTLDHEINKGPISFIQANSDLHMIDLVLLFLDKNAQRNFTDIDLYNFLSEEKAPELECDGQRVRLPEIKDINFHDAITRDLFRNSKSQVFEYFRISQYPTLNGFEKKLLLSEFKCNLDSDPTGPMSLTHSAVMPYKIGKEDYSSIKSMMVVDVLNMQISNFMTMTDGLKEPFPEENAYTYCKSWKAIQLFEFIQIMSHVIIADDISYGEMITSMQDAQYKSFVPTEDFTSYMDRLPEESRMPVQYPLSVMLEAGYEDLDDDEESDEFGNQTDDISGDVDDSEADGNDYELEDDECLVIDPSLLPKEMLRYDNFSVFYSTWDDQGQKEFDRLLQSKFDRICLKEGRDRFDITNFRSTFRAMYKTPRL